MPSHTKTQTVENKTETQFRQLVKELDSRNSIQVQVEKVWNGEMMGWEEGRERRRGAVITDVEVEPYTVEAQLCAIRLTHIQSFSVTTFVIV